jgi:hypothetical protein
MITLNYVPQREYRSPVAYHILGVVEKLHILVDVPAGRNYLAIREQDKIII